MNYEIRIEGIRLDVHHDESIRVNQTVQNVKDITKIFTDFTQSFSVPASDRNNAIFRHYYNFNIKGGFDARIKHDATITIDGYDFKTGKITLNDVKIEDGYPANYSIQFFGNVTQLSDKFGEDKLSSLEYLDNYNHAFKASTVETGATVGLFSKDIVYPLVSYSKRWIYQETTYPNTNKITNIAYNASFSEGILFSELKPAIRVDVILKAIEDKYDITFTRDFFDRDIWKDLYMNVSRGEGTLLTGATKEYYNKSFTIQTAYQYEYNPDFRVAIIITDVNPEAGFENVEYTIKYYINDEEVFESESLTGDKEVRYEDEDFDITGEINIRAEVVSNEPFSFNSSTRFVLKTYIFQVVVVDVFPIDYTTQNGIVTINSIPLVIKDQIADMTVKDWFKGITKMFNLIITPNDDGTLMVNDLLSWYKTGRIINIDAYSDESERTIKRGKLYNMIKLTYKDNESFLATNYEKTYKKKFGAINQPITVSNEPVLGDELEIELPFSNPVFSRLTNLTTNTLSGVQYGFIVDDKQETYDSKPFLFYANKRFGSIGFNGDTYKEITNAFIPSHNIEIESNSSFSAQFYAEFSEWTGGVLSNNLYSNFYQDYINDVFSPKRRVVEFRGKLPSYELTRIKNNDRLIYKGDRYLINNLEINITNGSVRFELVNDVFDKLDPPPAGFVSPNNVYVSRLAQTVTTTYYRAGSEGETVSITNPESWATVPSTCIVGQPITITLDENIFITPRTLLLTFNDGITNPIYSLLQARTRNEL